MRIVLIDDDPIVCTSLKTIIELSARNEGLSDVIVVKCGNNGADAISLYTQEKPDILLLDIQMKGMDGLEAAAHIMKVDPEARILFMTTFPDEEYILKALHLGAKGYLMKSSADNILPALLAIEKGQCVFGDEIVDMLPHMLATDKLQSDKATADARAASAFKLLSDSEWEIVKLLAQGQNNKEIATYMHFSEGTVRNYLSQILEKLDLRDRTQLAIKYYKEGFR